MKVLESHMEQSIQQVAGADALPIYNALKGKENVNEFTLVEELQLGINQIRNILYKLDKYGLLESKRKKDRLKFLEKKLAEEENSEFYFCQNGCTRVDAEQALEQGYMCRECGQLLTIADSQKIRARFKREIIAIKKEIETKEEEFKPKVIEQPVVKKKVAKKITKKKVAKKVVKKKTVKKKTAKKKVAKKVTKKKVVKKKVKK